MFLDSDSAADAGMTGTWLSPRGIGKGKNPDNIVCPFLSNKQSMQVTEYHRTYCIFK